MTASQRALRHGALHRQSLPRYLLARLLRAPRRPGPKLVAGRLRVPDRQTVRAAYRDRVGVLAPGAGLRTGDDVLPSPCRMERGRRVVIARRGVPHGSGLGVHRWVVQRTITRLRGRRGRSRSACKRQWASAPSGLRRVMALPVIFRWNRLGLSWVRRTERPGVRRAHRHTRPAGLGVDLTDQRATAFPQPSRPCPDRSSAKPPSGHISS